MAYRVAGRRRREETSFLTLNKRRKFSLAASFSIHLLLLLGASNLRRHGSETHTICKELGMFFHVRT